MSTQPIAVAHLSIPISSWKNLWSSGSSSGVPSNSGTKADVIGIVALDGTFHLQPALLVETLIVCYAALT